MILTFAGQNLKKLS